MKVELTQAGANITGRVLYAKTLASKQLDFDFDSGGNTSSIVLNYTGNGYGVPQMTIFYGYSTLILAGVNNLYSGGIILLVC